MPVLAINSIFRQSYHQLKSNNSGERYAVANDFLRYMRHSLPTEVDLLKQDQPLLSMKFSYNTDNASTLSFSLKRIDNLCHFDYNDIG